MPLSYVYEAIPELLQPVGSVSPEVLEATRALRWKERATRIHDDARAWSQSVGECKRVQAEMEADATISRVRREGCIEIAKKHADWELRNWGQRIHFESSAEERARMSPPTAPVLEIINWAREEARRPRDKARWECLAGRMPTSAPPQPEPVDPPSFLSPRPGLSYDEL
ncbi:uncharacterized protein LOC119308699 [Triticum dicoccoides]|uniref:uncharacterized protein LOC119308699 n=1 Tax=Triticum dicoccoides TaxID=85692 RepID=UPI000E79B901|nr:uncharacterized protein LOC119308699 [Triticum dicoccoides]XP_044388321.1 uncharacterized protein LOC123111575 [Triticum aestivum]